MKNYLFIFLVSISVFCTSLINAQTYVNQAAVGLNDGTSWLNAYTSLHDALENYTLDEEIWVTAGTYLPGESSAWTGTARNTFYIHQNVKLYGGFNGTEIAIEDRDPDVNITILSGDLIGDDVDTDLLLNRSDNVLEVLYVEASIDITTIIDGFTIKGGHADGDSSELANSRGGGIWSLGSPQIINCRFIENYAISYGAGLYLRDEASGETVVIDCVFENNLADLGGGGMVTSTASATTSVQVSNCSFQNNNSNFWGAGLYIFDSWVNVDDCTFAENTALASGGGLFVSLLGFDECSISNCEFNNNISSKGGGCSVQSAGGLASFSNTSFNYCSFTSNQAAVIFDDNFNDGGAMYIDYLGDPADNTVVVDDCFFQSNSARVGGGINVNHYDGSNNQLHIDGCDFLNNTSADAGAIQIWELGGNSILTTIQNSIFIGNSGNFFQAVAHRIATAGTDCKTEMTNCLFNFNGDDDPIKSVVAIESEMDVRSCTFSDNESTAINVRGTGNLTIQNTILSGIVNANIVVDDPDAASLSSNGGNMISDSSLEDWINALDQSETSPIYEVGTYMLAEESPGVDEGVILDDNPLVDIIGNDRVQGGCIDIGAFESSWDSGDECVTGISEELNIANNIVLYPNPTSDQFIVNLDIETYNITLFNVLGESVLILNQVTGVQTIDIRDLPNGNYAVLITSGKASTTKKISVLK